MRKSNKLMLLIGLLLIAVVLTACAASQPEPTSTPAATETSPPPTANPYPSGEGDCTMLTTVATTIYSLPSSQANVFSEAGAGFETVVTGRTADGWLGFDPGVAQAANVGPFRLRWIQLEDVSLSGNCVAVEEMWAPQPGLCYTVVFDLLAVYKTPFPGSEVLVTLDQGDFAAVLGLAGDNWAMVDLAPGNTGLDAIGWVDRAALYQNGTCDLPSIGN